MAKRKSHKGTVTERDVICICYGCILILLSVITLLHESTAIVGEFFSGLSAFASGRFYPFFCVLAIICGLYLIFQKKWPSLKNRWLCGGLVIYLAVATYLAIPADHKIVGFSIARDYWYSFSQVYHGYISAGGGLVGAGLYSALSYLFSYLGALICIIMLAVFGVLLIVDVNWLKNIWGHLAVGIQNIKDSRLQRQAEAKADQSAKTKPVKPAFTDITIQDHNQPEYQPDNTLAAEPAAPVSPLSQPVTTQPVKKPAESSAEGVKSASAGYAPPFSNYRLPRLTMLDSVVSTRSSANVEAAASKKDILLNILNQFDVPCELTGIHIGPAVTKFEVRPQSGIKVSKITSIQNDIKLGLAVRDLRIEAPVPGKNAVGIEIPNEERVNVRMSELFRNIPDKLKDKPLLFALGKDLSGENVFGQLDRMPHLLIAGATGSGKSVCINAIIASLLLRTTPNDVKLLLIDPKKVEFTPYIDVPHLIGPVITESNEAAAALNTIVSIMENRYTIFHDNNVKNITEYNQKAAADPNLKHMVYIVIIIDELADLMVSHSKDVEQSIQRITQLARASGIHLIVATQRPSTDVITGTIKTNIPSRIAFAVSSAIDSRIILDTTGAEDLLGNGDMLYIPMGESTCQRIQGVYVTEKEIDTITNYVKTQGKPNYDDAFIELSAQMAENEDGTFKTGVSGIDPQYEEVKQFVIQTQKASTSAIQRYFGFGYNRSARIVDMLQQEGIVGPVNGSKPREVYVKPDNDPTNNT